MPYKFSQKRITLPDGIASYSCGCRPIEDRLSIVLESRPALRGVACRRRRECCHCGKKWTTYELHQLAVLELEKAEAMANAMLNAARRMHMLADGIDAIANSYDEAEESA